MRNEELDRASSIPLWAQLHSDLLYRIRSGEFGDRFPGEVALVGQYSVSRATVRRALHALREEGILFAGRGQQPRLVSSPHIEQPLGSLYSLFASVEAAGMTQESIVRELKERYEPEVARHLQLPASESFIYLKRLRLADGESIAIDQVWVPSHFGRPLLEVDFSYTSLYREMRDLCGCAPTEGREQISAIVLTAAQASELGCEQGLAAFEIKRLASISGETVEWRRSLVRADRLHMTAEYSSMSPTQSVWNLRRPDATVPVGATRANTFQ